MKDWTTSCVCIATLTAAGCGAPGDHPDPRETLDRPPAVVVGSVGSSSIGAGEARVFAERTGEAADVVARKLADRELLVRAADVSHVELDYIRKQALVRAFLEDEIESSVELTEAQKESAVSNLRGPRRELVGPCGFEMFLLKVEPETVGEPARDAVRDAAARGFARSTSYVGASSGGVQKLQSIDSFGLAGAFEMTVERGARVSDPRCVPGDTADGWIKHTGLANGAIRFGLNTPFSVGFAQGDYVAFATARIPGDDPTDEEVEALAKAQTLERKRSAALQELVENLRSEGDVALFPEGLDGRSVGSP